MCTKFRHRWMRRARDWELEEEGSKPASRQRSLFAALRHRLLVYEFFRLERMDRGSDALDFSEIFDARDARFAAEVFDLLVQCKGRGHGFLLNILNRMGESAAPALLDSLARQNPWARRHATEILHKVAPEALTCHLSTLLQDADEKVRTLALEHMVSLEHVPECVAESAVQSILAEMDGRWRGSPSSDNSIQCQAWERVGAAGIKAIPQLLRITDASPVWRARALGALESLGDAGMSHVLPKLLDWLHGDNAELRREAALSLRDMTADISHLAKEVIKTLRNGDVELRFLTLQVLAKMGPVVAEQVLPELAPWVAEDCMVRRTLLKMGPEGLKCLIDHWQKGDKKTKDSIADSMMYVPGAAVISAVGNKGDLLQSAHQLNTEIARLKQEQEEEEGRREADNWAKMFR